MEDNEQPSLNYEQDGIINLFPLPVPDFSFQAGFQKKRVRRSMSVPNVPGTPRKSRIKHIAPMSPLSLSSQFQPSPLTPKLSQVESNHYFENTFDQISLIGEGSFSKVYKARHIGANKPYAIKVSNKEIYNIRQMSRAIKEIKSVKKLSHPHVLKYIFAWIQNQKLYIQTELCEHGNLFNFIQEWVDNHENEKKFLDESVIWNYFVDLLLGLHYIHSSNLLHLDIKPANIFIDSNNRLIIGDFGLTVKRKKNKIINNSNNEENSAEENIFDDHEDGDAKYLAKEAMNGTITEAADIFSLGVTLFELTTLYIEIPTYGPTWELLRCGNVTSHADFPSHYSSELKLLIDKMTNPNFRERPSADALLEHPRVVEIIMRRIELFKSDDEYINSLPSCYFPSKEIDFQVSKRSKFASLPSSFKSFITSEEHTNEPTAPSSSSTVSPSPVLTPPSSPSVGVKSTLRRKLNFD